MNQKWIVFIVLLGLAATASAAPQKTTPKVSPPIEQRTVSIDYKMGDIQAVFKDIARQLGTDLQADNNIGGKASLTMRNAQLSQVMDMICHNFHCAWKVQKGTPPKLVITSQPAATH
jgi:hypothetical protein